MQTITLKFHVGQDGILHLDIPVDVTNADLTVTFFFKAINDSEQQNKPKGKGWPANFIALSHDLILVTHNTKDSVRVEG
jgi:hypothetical protein